MRISDWSSDVCSSDLGRSAQERRPTPFDDLKLKSCSWIPPPAIEPTSEPPVNMREPRINGFGIPVLFHANKRGTFECEQRRQAPSRSRFSCALASASRTASPSCWTEKGFGRSDGRRGGKGGVRTCRSRWSPYL